MDVAPVLLIGGSDRQRQERAQGIHGQVHLRVPAAFGPIVARSGATFRRRLERAAIDNGGRRQGVASWGHPQHLTKVMHKLAVLICYAYGQPCADPVTHPTRAQILAWNDATAARAKAAQDGPGDAICTAVE